jgi:formate dehydrogenase major subunit
MATASDGELDAQKSICPFCGVGCGLTYNEDNGKGTGWEASVNTRGELCPKGAAAFEMLDADDRLTQPMVRENGHLVTASWDEAFDRIVENFSEIIEEYGPEALGFFASSNCTNEENYLYQKIARKIGSNNIDNCARLCHASTVAAMGQQLNVGAMTNTTDDLGEADLFLVCGANPAEQHPVIFNSHLGPALRDGTEMIHIDPRENQTTRQADLHVGVTPGYDIPVLNSIAKVILEEGLYDEEFVETRTEGFEAFEEHLSDVDVAENASLAGVEEETIRDAAHRIAEADRVASFTGMGMSQHMYGTDNVHALINLVLLTGNIGKPGTGVNPLRGQNNVQGAADVGTNPSALPGYQSVEDPEVRADFEEVWGFEPPAEPGLTETEASMAVGDEIHGLYVFAENPAITEPNSNQIKKDLDEAFLVVQDLFMTETAEHADVILPGSAWAEKTGTVTNTDRRVQMMRQMRAPPGDAKTDLEIIKEFGRRMTDLDVDFEDAEAVFDELTDVSPIYAGMDYDGIGDSFQRWPFYEGAEEGVDILHEEEFFGGEKTAPFSLVGHIPPGDEVGEDELVLTTGRVLQHFNSGALSRRTETLMRMRGEDTMEMHPADAEARGIEDGDWVTVENERGEVEVEVAVTPAITEGSVFMTFHYAEPLVNSLVGDYLDPVAKIPEYKHSAVSVSLAE